MQTTYYETLVNLILFSYAFQTKTNELEPILNFISSKPSNKVYLVNIKSGYMVFKLDMNEKKYLLGHGC